MQDSFLPLPDQASPNALLLAVDWIGQVLTGTVATSIAILAIAAVGLTLLSGRVPFKRGLGVVVGCFIVFSARSIARGVMTVAQASDPPTTFASVVPIVPLRLPLASPPTAYDPYAGASVPATRPDRQDLFGGRH